MSKPPYMKHPNNYFPVSFRNVQYIQSPQSDWSQTDPSKPDYIKNKEEAEKVRPIAVNGNEFLSDSRESGAVNFVEGRNISLETEGNSIKISAVVDAIESDYVEGKGIDIVQNDEGQRVISIEPGSIGSEMIESVSTKQITQEEGEILILNGGGANG